MDVPAPDPKKARRAALAKAAKLPLLSGKASAFVLTVCFAVAAGVVLLIDAPLGLPVWVRVETALATCWLVWVSALTAVLYQGRRVSHDHTMATPRNWFGNLFQGPSWGDFADVAWLGEGCGEGCAVALGVVAAVFIAVVGFWFLIEVAIPGIAFIIYFLIRGMLARVANDDHCCTGRFGRALAWAALWATVYMAPLALLTWVGHLIVVKPPAA
jgi:hypothetical protein